MRVNLLVVHCYFLCFKVLCALSKKLRRHVLAFESNDAGSPPPDNSDVAGDDSHGQKSHGTIAGSFTQLGSFGSAL